MIATVLLAIDYSNLVFRHACNPYGSAHDAAGRSVNGPVGAGAQILRLIDERQPTHLLIARDGARSAGFRREIDPTYKAHRKDGDPEITRQFDLAYKMADVLGWPLVAADSYEADDVIASAVSAYDGPSVVVSGDKDLLALCAPDIEVMLLVPGGARLCGVSDCEEIFGVGPERVADYKALVGDPSDGISGVAGIGAKGAAILLALYPELEPMLLDAEAGRLAEEIAPALARKLTAGVDAARTSRQLALLVRDLEIDLEALRFAGTPADSVAGSALEALELSALRAHLPGAPPPVAGPKLDFKATFAAALKSSE